MRIVMTGASGFMGSEFLRALPTDWEVFALGRSLPAGVATDRVQLVPCDLGRPGALANIISDGGLPGQIDAVCHMAVSRLHRDFPNAALDLFQVNAGTAIHLLEYARAAGATRFVLVSTGSVYDGVMDTALDEAMPLAPTKYWPVSKLCADLLAQPYQQFFPISTLRFFTPYGPGQSDRLIPGLIQRVKGGQPVTIPQTGGGISFSAVYSDDMVRVLQAAVGKPWSGIVNVGGRETVDILSAATVIAKILGRSLVVERVAGAPATVLRPKLDRLASLIDLDTFIPFEEGVRRIIEMDGWR